MYIPLPRKVAQIGSTVDLPLEALLHQQTPRVAYTIENAVSLNGFSVASVKSIFAQDEKEFREKIISSARKAYREEKESMLLEIDENSFLELIEEQTSLLCNGLRGCFTSKTPRVSGRCVVDTETGLVVCREDTLAQGYLNQGDVFAMKSFQVI